MQLGSLPLSYNADYKDSICLEILIKLLYPRGPMKDGRIITYFEVIATYY